MHCIIVFSVHMPTMTKWNELVEYWVEGYKIARKHGRKQDISYVAQGSRSQKG
jgi:hypothetical protein